MTVVRSQNGFLTPAVGQAWVFAILGVVVGTFIGTKVFNRISADVLRKVVYGYMAVSGVVALLK